MAGTLTVKPGETVTVVGIPADAPLPPYIPGPVDPGYSPPWAQLPGVPGPGGPVDPGYSPPWAQVRPPVDPGYSPPWAQVPDKPPLPPGPVDPGYSPPWAQIEGEDKGKWCWAYSPQTKRWMWVRVPGEGEAGPK
jgi:hypothetical protein